MNKKWLFILCFIISNSLFAVEKLVVTGSSTIAPLLSDIAKMYENDNHGVRIDVQTGGSSRGISDARKELAQIGMVSRKLKTQESDLNSYLIAKDGIAVILHLSNSVKEISFENIQKIYLGKITNWKELGGEEGPIVVVNKAEGRSTLELFLRFFHLKNSEIKASVIIGDNEQGIKTVSKNKYAIGYVSVGTAEYNRSVGTPIKLLPMNGVAASVENVEKNIYPISRELNLVIKMKPTGEIKKFLDFVRSKKTVDIIKEHYFVSINTK